MTQLHLHWSIDQGIEIQVQRKYVDKLTVGSSQIAPVCIVFAPPSTVFLQREQAR